MIPLVHDFSAETVLVFGGGPVGARKARRFTQEARVVVLSLTFADEPFGGAERVKACPDPGDVSGWLDRLDPALVVAATDDQALNDAIERAAADRGVLVNRADVRGSRSAGSVVVPATIRDGPLVVAVSTEGTDPGLAKSIRERLEASLQPLMNAANTTAEHIK